MQRGAGCGIIKGVFLQSAIESGVMMKKIGALFWLFFRIGAFTFGGGYAMIALLEEELVEKKKWIGKDAFLDMVAIAESTPGPLAVNSATYIGYRMGGFFGAAAATFAVCLPSFGIIFAISFFLDAFLHLTWVSYAFRGIRVCVVYLILSAGVKMLRGLPRDAFSVMVFLFVLVLMLFFSLTAVSFSSVFYVLLGGLAGVFLYVLRRLRRKGDGK